MNSLGQKGVNMKEYRKLFTPWIISSRKQSMLGGFLFSKLFKNLLQTAVSKEPGFHFPTLSSSFFFFSFIIINIKNSSLLKRKGTTVGDEFKPALCCGGGPGNKKHETTNIFLSMLSSYRKKFPSYVMISMNGNTEVVDREMDDNKLGRFFFCTK